MRRYLPALLLASLAAVQLLFTPAAYLGAESDDLLYVLAARSLLEGRYALGVLPGDPLLLDPTPGWPLLLLPAAAVSDDAPWGYALWSWAWLAAADVLAWLWLRRRMDGPAAAAATVLFALNPLVLSRAGLAMSEVPFLALALGILLALERGLKGRVAGPLLALGWLIRPGAWALSAAAVAHYLARGRRRDAAWAAAWCAAAPAAWAIWTVWAAGAAPAEAAELRGAYGGGALDAAAAVVLGNAREAAALWGQTLLPAPPGTLPAFVATGLGAAAGLAALWGAGRRTASASEDGGSLAAAVYLYCGVLLHLFWPWWYERYLVPYVPFLVWGIWLAFRDAGPKRAALALAVLAALSVPVQAAWLWGRLPELRRPDLEESYAWVRRLAPEHALIASLFCARDAWHAGRPCLPLTSVPEGADLAAFLEQRRVRYVLWQEGVGLGFSRGSRSPWSRRPADLRRALEGAGFRRAQASGRGAVYERLSP